MATQRAVRAEPPVPPNVERVTKEEFLRWEPADFVKRLYRPIFYDTGYHARGPQTLSQLADLPSDEQRLAMHLTELSSKRKFVYSANRQKAIDFSNSIKDELETLHAADLKSGKLIREDIKRLAIEGTGRDMVEVAAWRITLKNGRVLTGEHTSKSLGAVTSDDAVLAWNGIVEKNKIEIGDIARVQWLHSHPGKALSAVPLSEGDELLFRTFRSELNQKGGKEIPITVYSIYQATNTLAISSMDF